jgi:ABC-2 type transport system ATP-binding protein
MRILTGYMPPTAGKATIAGFDTIAHSIDARRHLGYMPETVPLYPEMSVESYLAYMGRLRRLDNLWERVDDALEAVDMLNRAEAHIGKLSKGMRQRVGLAQAILHDPDVLILDEPTIGLDPAQIIEVRQLIAELGKRHTILLSTHILSEVEQLCSRVIIIIDGRIVADMPMDEVLGREGGINLLLRVASPPADGAAILAALPGVERVTAADGGAYRLQADGRNETLSGIARAAVDSGWGLLELATERQTLEAIFLEKLRDSETEPEDSLTPLPDAPLEAEPQERLSEEVLPREAEAE